ncbi:MAG: sulfurtransferase TusA family protein [Oscillospiraceae bacterium]|nr:sulfurtransferase TusA family protein [Oscillospiraceae bacterium]
MIDARGLACPLPVLKVQQEVKKNAPNTLEVLVDNNAAVQNVTRFANNAGYKVSVKELEDEEFSLTLTK